MDVRRLVLAALIAVTVAAVIVFSVTPWDVPGPAPASAPAPAFSSARAMEALRVIAAAPRPIGSARAAVVRGYLRERLQALGLSPYVQEAEVVSAGRTRVAGRVRNLVGRLAGRDPSRAVLLVAHYDSVPTAAGAADDGSGVAVLLEAARALRAGPPLRNDVVFLFTDGEERGLLGAQAFLRDDPWAYGVGVALNVDSPGSSSPLLMYETSRGNGRLVEQYLAAGRPYGSSLMYEVSRRLPVVSDFRALTGHGIPGLSFGMLDGPAYDHTAYDSLDTFDEAALQHAGETVLALTRRFGEADLWRMHASDVVYFNVVGSKAISYPVTLVRPFLALALALYVGAVALAARRRLLTARGVARATLATVGALAASLAAVGLVWAMYRTAYEDRAWTGTGVVISDWYRLGLVLLSSAVVLLVYALLLRRLRAWDVAVVALAWWAAAAVAVCIVFPGAGHLLTWPLAGAALGLAGAALVDGAARVRPAAALIALAGAVPGLMLLSSAFYLLLMSAGLEQGVTVLSVWLLAGLLVLPLAVVLPALRVWLPGALAAAGLVILFAVGSTVAFDSEHPRFTSVSYRLAADGGTRWETIDRNDDYTRAFLGAHPQGRPVPEYYPHLGPRLTLGAPAPDYGLRPPRLSLLSDAVVGDRRTVRVRVRPGRDAAVVSLVVHTVVGRLSASVHGHELGGADTALLDGSTVRWSFDYHAPPPEGIVVTLRFAAGRSVLLRAVDYSYGLPAGAAGAYPARPAGMLPGGLGDGTLTEAALRLPATTGAAPTP